MTLDIAHAARVDAGLRKRLLDRGDLTVDAGGGEPDLARAVIAQATAEDDGVDVVAVGDRVLEPLQQDDARAAAEDGPAGRRVERAAMTVRRHHAAFLMQIAAMLRERDRRAASQRHVRLVQQQALAGLRHRDERGRASGLDGQTGAPQVQLVRRTGGEKFPPGAHQDRVFADLERAGEVLDGLSVAADVVQEIGVHAATGEDADRASIGCRVVASILQRLPGAFEKDAVLRIGQRRFTIAHVEKSRIELLDVVEHWASLYVSGRRPGRCVCAVFKLRRR